LNIDTVPLEDHQVKITVEVDPESFESSKRRAARKLSKRAKIPGFRPGKAPYPVIARHIGESAILEEAVEITIDEIYPKVIEKAEIEPYGPGTLEGIPEMDPPTFEFVVPLRATVELGDYQSIRLPYELEDITDNDIDDVINNLREQQAVIEPVERSAQEGDLVTVRLDARRTKIEEDEDPILIENRKIPVVIEAEGGDQSEEWPFPGFSRELIGTSKEDEKTIVYSYPEDTPIEAYQGLEVEFTILVEDVRSRSLPETNDDFAQTVGEFETLEDLRSTIQDNLELQSRQTYEIEYDDEVMEEIVSISTISYPPQMLEQEINIVINNMKSQLESQGLDIDLYLKSREIDMDGLNEEAKPVAETRLEKSLVLLEIAEQEEIQVDPEELQEETNQTLEQASQSLSEKELRELTSKDSATNLVSNIMMDLLLRHTQERIRDIARGLESPEQSIDSAEDETVSEISTEMEYDVSEEAAAELEELVDDNEVEKDQLEISVEAAINEAEQTEE
jgi:trigger factor